MLAIASIACRTSSTGPDANQLRISITSDPKTFDPLQVNNDSDQTVSYLTSGVLVRVNRATNALEPELAESWKVSDDGRSIAFHLRSGLKFSDNSPLDANDVARTFNSALDPKLASPVGDAFLSDAGNPSVTEKTPLDVSIAYAQPKPSLDSLFDTLPITPRTQEKFPATAGPFFVSDHHPGEYVLLTRNSHYWKHDSSGKQLPYLDSVRISIQGNRDLQLERFVRGEADMLEKITPAGFDRIEKAVPGAARSLGPSLDSESLWFNESPVKMLPEWKRTWFRSAAFRHAVSLAINRDDISRVVYGGQAHPSAGPVSPANRFWFNAALKPLPFDPAAAQKLLTADGFALARWSSPRPRRSRRRVFAGHQRRQSRAGKNGSADSGRSCKARNQSRRCNPGLQFAHRIASRIRLTTKPRSCPSI